MALRDAPLIEQMRELAGQYPRFGYRRIHVFIARCGHLMSTDRMHRLWRLAKLQVPRKRSRKRISISRPRPVPALGVNQVWAYDFVFDACANGQQLKCLTVIDEFTRECLAIGVAGSIRSGRVIEVLSKLVSAHGRRSTCARTTGRSSFRELCCVGYRNPTSMSHASIRESHGRTDRTNDSTASLVPHDRLGTSAQVEKQSQQCARDRAWSSERLYCPGVQSGKTICRLIGL